MPKLRFIILSVLFFSNLNLNAQNSPEIHKLIEQEKYSQAMAKIDQKLINNANDKELLYFKAQVELKLKNVNEAIKTYQLIVKLYPSFPEAYNNLAEIFARQGKLELAKEILEKGMATNSSYALLHNNINSIYLEMARESYVKALQLGVKKHVVALRLASLDYQNNTPLVINKTEVKQKTLGPKKTIRRVTSKDVAVKAWSEPVISVKDEVITALQGWAAAWSAQDVDLYLSFYNKQFIPENGANKRLWTAQRQSRLLKPRWIEVRLSDFLFKQQSNDQAEVKLTQSYRSNSLRDKSKKKFLLKRSEDGWQILNEINFQE